MKVYIGTDHRGVETQNKIVNYLKDLGIDINISKLKHNDNDDYHDFAFDVCKRVVDNKNSLGILICGTGIGMSIAANKVKGIRAARCVNTDDAFFARNHNDNNVLCISSNNDINNIYEKMRGAFESYLAFLFETNLIQILTLILRRNYHDRKTFNSTTRKFCSKEKYLLHLA